MKKLLTVASLLFFLFISSINCARKGNPTGGPKDSIAPVMVTANPAYGTTKFRSKKIKLSFDEYIKFKDLNKQLIISPPLKNNPIIKPQGTASKNISIEIIDTLIENTTYSINFGNSVIDNNEGNILGKFKYVFSTGDYVDSLSTGGTVKDAFEKKQAENISVLLYEITESYNDSVPFLEKPTYVTNTLDTTNYDLTNLRAGKYQLIALKDFNNDYMYNPKQDKIAFLDTPIEIPNDTIYPELKLFKEIPAFSFAKPSELKKGKIIFGYEGKLKDYKIDLVSEVPDNFKSFLNKETGKDTLNFWYTPFETDSLQFRLQAHEIDTVYTVKLRTSKTDTLTVTPTVKNTLHPKDTFGLATTIPIESIDLSKINITDKDTLIVDFKGIINEDKNKLLLNFNRTKNNSYQIDVLSDALIDFRGNTNDTLQYFIKTLNEEAYGIIELKLTSKPNAPVKVDLINRNGDVLFSQYDVKKSDFVFKDLPPNIYTIRVIIDQNKNGSWDSGNFLEKTQPEEVYYYPTELDLRANWTINEVFDLQK